jgi:hypothetical protein
MIVAGLVVNSDALFGALRARAGTAGTNNGASRAASRVPAPARAPPAPTLRPASITLQWTRWWGAIEELTVVWAVNPSTVAHAGDG